MDDETIIKVKIEAPSIDGRHDTKGFNNCTNG